MSLTVCTSSTGTDGCFIKTAKALMGITGASDDALIGTLATRALESVEAYLGYPLRLQVYSESVPAFGSRYLMLSRTPIRVIFRAFTGTDTGTATAFCSTDYRVEDADAGLISRDAGFDWTAPIATDFVTYHRPGQEERPWLFEYSAGYRVVAATSTDYGITSTGAELPGDIAQAIDETVKGWYLARTQDVNVSSVSVGSLSMTFRDQSAASGGASLPLSATKLLSRYRRLA